MVRGLLLALWLLAALGPSTQLTVLPPINKGSTCGDSPGGSVPSDGPNSEAYSFSTAVMGSFLLSCNTCSLSGNIAVSTTTLHCGLCTKPDGSKSASSILVSTCRTKVFKNVDGQLLCETSLPQGDFQSSCRDCTVTGTLLECLCDGYPAGIRTSMVMGSCSRFSNENGRLVCTPGYGNSE